MFRKLVSNLAFSPALVGQLGFYAKRLRKEEATRRIGLIFTALALVVQSFAVFSPPESANAASDNDIIRGGCSTKECITSSYDNNVQGFRDFIDHFGITRAELAAGTWNGYGGGYHIRSSEWPISFGRNNYNNRDGTVVVNGTTYYYGHLSAWDTHGESWYAGLRGWSAKAGEFHILANCANLGLKTLPPPPPPPMCAIPGKTHLPLGDPNCKPDPMCTIPGKTHLRADDPACKPDPVAACSSLRITKLSSGYQLTGESTTGHGASVQSYTYVVKRDGKVVDTITQQASSLRNVATTKQTAQGTYTVELTVKTSLGDKTSPDCVKTFTIPPPAMCPQNPLIRADSPECQPCPGDPSIWIKDDKCKADLVLMKTASNITQSKVDANTTTARAADKIMFTLEINNKGKAPAEITPTEPLGDVMEYATIADAGGGIYNAETKTLTWPTVTLKPGEKQTRIFSVKVLDTIPAMATGASNPASYDCKMVNTFGNTVEIGVDCPPQKTVVEQTVDQLPHTGPRENMIFAGVLAAVVVYFYARARQVKKEVRLIRRDLNAGTI